MQLIHDCDFRYVQHKLFVHSWDLTGARKIGRYAWNLD